MQVASSLNRLLTRQPLEHFPARYPGGRLYGTRILDTRKTTPAMRYLERYAVRVGGGTNHRFGLHDQFLIKDNHLKLGKGSRRERILEMTARAREYNPNIQVEIEVESEYGCGTVFVIRLPFSREA